MTSGKNRLSAGRIALAIGALIIVALALYLAFNLTHIRSEARLGAAYGARVACSCRFVAGRSLEDCRRDFEPGMEIVSLAEQPAQRRVIASVPLLARAAAERRGEFGCVLLTEEELERLD